MEEMKTSKVSEFSISPMSKMENSGTPESFLVLQTFAVVGT